MPDRADFIVEGARGFITKREKRDNFMVIYKTLLESVPMKVQLQIPLPNITEMERELLRLWGINDPDRFIGGNEEPAAGSETGPTVPEDLPDDQGEGGQAGLPPEA